MVESGPGYARILQKNTDGWRERISAPASGSAAHVNSEVAFSGGTLTRRIKTNFLDGTVRRDVLTLEGQHLTCQTEWKFSKEFSARASYGPNGRILEYLNSSGDVLAGFETTFTTNQNGFSSQTNQVYRSEDNTVVIGSKLVHPGTSSTVIGPAPSGETTYMTVTKDLDGTTHVSQFLPQVGSGNASAGATGTIYPDGSQSSQGQVWQVDQNGQTAIVTKNSSFTIDGATTTSSGTVGTTPEGGFYSHTVSSDTDGTSQRSSFVADGQGNSSETTITYGSDGSFKIVTTSTDSAGNTTTSSSSYDKDGNPTGGTTDGGGGDDGNGDGDGGDTEGGGGDGGDGDTEGGGDGDTGSYPADDGSDPSPRPNWRGGLNARLDFWLDNFGSRAGGALLIPIIPPEDLGDPVPMLNSACEDDIKGYHTEGPALTNPDTFDLRPFLNRPHDPENDPRALIEALQNIDRSWPTLQLSRLATTQL